jgi:glutaredoxin
MHEVVVYSRRECHLCDVVKETLTLAHGKAAFVWREVDIDSDSQLSQQYNHEVPVVFIDGRKAFKYRMNEEEFLRKMSGRA